MDISWNVSELENSFIPNDFHHLWSILGRNPDKIVSMNSIKTDLKLIKGILPYEVKEIYKEVLELLQNYLDIKEEPKSVCEPLFQFKNTLFQKMAVSYLKFGLAGIEIKIKEYCMNCGLDKDKNDKIEENTCIKLNQFGHDLHFESIYGYTIITCQNCGDLRKLNNATTAEEAGVLGPCKSYYNNHMFQEYRQLYCPINE